MGNGINLSEYFRRAWRRAGPDRVDRRGGRGHPLHHRTHHHALLRLQVKALKNIFLVFLFLLSLFLVFLVLKGAHGSTANFHR